MAFTQVKAVLCGSLLLHSLEFSLPFYRLMCTDVGGHVVPVGGGDGVSSAVHQPQTLGTGRQAQHDRERVPGHQVE